jgi:hypothetical protein
MGEKPEDHSPTQSAHADLQTLTRQLREQARQLGDTEAIAAADELHEHTHAERPNPAHIRPLLASLETKIGLSPTVNAILQALSNVGM